jgi:hypothetical protein
MYIYFLLSHKDAVQIFSAFSALDIFLLVDHPSSSIISVFSVNGAKVQESKIT